MNKFIALICATLFTFVTSTAVFAEDPAPAEDNALTKLVKKGAKVYRKCKACHALEAPGKKIGPHLEAIIGRKAASVEGFKYSAAMAAKGTENILWTEENLDKFLEKPRKFVEGTKMAFSGLRREKDRKALIAYLKSLIKEQE